MQVPVLRNKSARRPSLYAELEVEEIKRTIVLNGEVSVLRELGNVKENHPYRDTSYMCGPM